MFGGNPKKHARCNDLQAHLSTPDWVVTFQTWPSVQYPPTPIRRLKGKLPAVVLTAYPRTLHSLVSPLPATYSKSHLMHSHGLKQMLRLSFRKTCGNGTPGRMASCWRHGAHTCSPKKSFSRRTRNLPPLSGPFTFRDGSLFLPPSEPEGNSEGDSFGINGGRGGSCPSRQYLPILDMVLATVCPYNPSHAWILTQRYQLRPFDRTVQGVLNPRQVGGIYRFVSF